MNIILFLFYIIILFLLTSKWSWGGQNTKASNLINYLSFEHKRVITAPPLLAKVSSDIKGLSVNVAAAPCHVHSMLTCFTVDSAGQRQELRMNSGVVSDLEKLYGRKAKAGIVQRPPETVRCLFP